ncbi:MAG TPA: allantoinase AllB [Vicinamibacterales bacterium]|nr:allantoinase AllB [Vicinamibacterales bacterium]
MMIIRSKSVVLPDAVGPASIEIESGQIVDVVRSASASSDRSDVVDYGNLVVSPGIIDTHVHVNEPGRTDWEGFDTATRAAAAGGVTTIVDMPLNSIPATTTVAALAAKRSAARGKCHVHAGFWGGVVPGNAPELDALADAGVRGFKCFLVPSGVDEFAHVGETDLRAALPILARRRLPLLVHAESPARLRTAPADCDPRVYANYLGTRPPAAEVDAIEMMVRLAKEFDAAVHIVHVACAEAVDVIARAKADGAPITAETCPHYLTFASDDVAGGATQFKCAPPIRESRHRDALWSGLRGGALDLVATDHSPAPPSMKNGGDFIRAWGGIASLEMALAAVWTGSSKSHALPAAMNLTTWMSERPAALARLERKGQIAAGFDADLVVWSPDEEWTVDPGRLQQRHKLTPYGGRTLRGRVKTTFVRGVRVWDDGRLVSAGTGQLL